jgi:hypothetical protein
MARTKIVHMSSGYVKVLRSASDLVVDATGRVAGNAGEEFEIKVIFGGFGGGRLIGFVIAATPEAQYAEAVYKTLSKAVK